MQAGTLAGGDIRVVTSSVLVNGILREHLSWSVDRELSGDMPDQVVATSGITQATGTIQFAGAEVESMARNPFNRSTGWLPRIGDRVQIYSGDETTSWVQFTGRVDKVTGNLTNGFRATIIDDYDKLSASVTHLPLLRIMPPISNGDPYRGVGLSSIHYVDHALRAAGFYSTPPTEYDNAIAVTCQGSMWPNGEVAGTLVEGGAYDTTGSHHSNNTAPWGWSVGNFNNKYSPRVSYASSRAVQLTAMVAPDHAGSFFLTAYYGTATVQLAVGTTRVAILRVNGTEACRITLGTAIMVTALLKGGVVTLKTDKGTTATGSATIGGTAMSSVLTSGDTPTRVAGLQVSHPATTSQEFASLSWVPSAVLDLSATSHIGIIDAGPTIERTSAADLLEEISSATLCGMWINEAGVLQYVPTLALRSRAPARTLTTLDDILDLDWEDSLLGSRSKVTVTGRKPAISKAPYRSKELWRGSGGSLSSQEKSEDIVGSDDDVDWIMPDESMTVLNPAPWSLYNAGLETFGGVFYSSSGDTVSGAGLTTAITMTNIGVTKYKITHQAGTFPSDVTANMATSPTDTTLWPRNRDNPLPVIKGFGKVEWFDVTVVPTTAGGIGPELVHDVGPWNNREDSDEWLSRIADYLAAQTATPLPTITGLEVVDDPRLQLGDVVTVSSDRLLGVTMNALIVGMNRSGDKDGTTLSLSVRIISVETTFTTYRAYNDALVGANLTYAQWDALGPKPQRYDEFNDAA